MSRQILVQKATEVEEIKKLLQDYKIVGVANLQKVRAAQLQEIKKKLKNLAYIRVIKNTLIRRAILQNANKPGLEKLEPMMSGANITLFTNVNPFKLSLLLEKSRVKTTAKAGDIAAIDVIVPAGNTGLAPGPIISQLGSVGLPTRIEAGSVWVNKDTLVARKGDVIDARLASVLSKLNIKPVEAGLMLKVVYDEGFLITDEQLHLNLEDFRKSLVAAESNALSLSLNSGYPMQENISLLLQTAHRKAFNLALNAGIPTKETIGDLLRKAHIEGLSLSSKVEEKTKSLTEQTPGN